GSGKTTLLNLLGALDRPTKGDIKFDGDDIISMSESKRDKLRKKKMGFVFQSVALVSLMSAYENVDFGLRISEYDKKQRRDRAKECLAFVGLSNRIDHKPYELS